MSSKKTPLYVERRKDGAYAVEKPGSERASAILPTQKKAIDWAKDHTDAAVHVERVRNTSAGGGDQWRKP